MAPMQWYGDEAERRIRQAVGRRVDAAARHLRDRIREKVSEANAQKITKERYKAGMKRSRRRKKGPDA